MCIAIPKKVLRINREDKKAIIEDRENEHIEVDISLYEHIEVNSYVLIQSGFVVQVLTEEEARESLDLWEAITKHN